MGLVGGQHGLCERRGERVRAGPRRGRDRIRAGCDRDHVRGRVRRDMGRRVGAGPVVWPGHVTVGAAWGVAGA
jgi:hypothetical protein